MVDFVRPVVPKLNEPVASNYPPSRIWYRYFSELDRFVGTIDDNVSAIEQAQTTATTAQTTATAATSKNTEQDTRLSAIDTSQTVQDNRLQALETGKLDASAYTAADVFSKVLAGDGAGSGLDADNLDGQSGAYHLSRGNHTGTQAISSVSGLQAALDAKLAQTAFATPAADAGLATTHHIDLTLSNGDVFRIVGVLNP